MDPHVRLQKWGANFAPEFIDIEKLKLVDTVIDLPSLNKYYLEFINFFSYWNCADIGNVLKMILSPFDKASLARLVYFSINLEAF